MVVVGTQLTNTLLGDAFRRSRPPFVVTAIFDPSLLRNGEYVTPPRPTEMAIISDRVPEEGPELFRVASAIMPNLRTVGILTNRGEANSISSARAVGDVFTAHGIQVTYGYLSSPDDVSPVTRTLLRSGNDLLIIPHDKIAVEQAETISQLAFRYDTASPRPVLSLDEGTVRNRGVTACVSADYVEIGAEAARLALAQLSGKQLSKLAVVFPPHAGVFVNRRRLDSLNLKLTDSSISYEWVQ